MAGERILIVDDDPLNTRLLEDVLRHHGYTVQSVGDGQACIDVAPTFRPAVVLMDIHMPGLGGIETIKRMRRHAEFAGIRFVALTASVMPHEIESFRAVGFDAFHAKPINIIALLTEIEGLIGAAAT